MLVLGNTPPAERLTIPLGYALAAAPEHLSLGVVVTAPIAITGSVVEIPSVTVNVLVHCKKHDYLFVNDILTSLNIKQYQCNIWIIFPVNLLLYECSGTN